MRISRLPMRKHSGARPAHLLNTPHSGNLLRGIIVLRDDIFHELRQSSNRESIFFEDTLCN